MTILADLSKTLDLSILKDKSVLVTGGASGLGALIASSFAEDGLDYVPTDVTDWQSQVKAFKNAAKFSSHKTIDIVVACAAVGGQSFIAQEEEPPSLEKDPPMPPTADAVFNINAKGVYYTSKLAQHYFPLLPSPQTRATSTYRKCLVVISSLAGYLEINAVDYTACKWAVRGLFRSTRSIMEDLGYRMNLIAPWIMDTPMSRDFAEMCRKKGIPVGRADDVASAVIRCAADDPICGRALAIGATETFDLRDDLEGLNSGIELKKYLEGEAKELMELQGQRV